MICESQQVVDRFWREKRVRKRGSASLNPFGSLAVDRSSFNVFDYCDCFKIKRSLSSKGC